MVSPLSSNPFLQRRNKCSLQGLRAVATLASSLAMVLIGGDISGTGAIAQTIIQSDPTPATSPAQERFRQLLTVPSTYEIDLGYLGDRSNNWPVVTEESTSLRTATNPSLWWSRDQLPNTWRADGSTLNIANYRLIRGWNAFHSKSADTYIVDFEMDPQYWNRLNYVQQYAVLNQLGTSGMSFGHNVRIYSAFRLIGVYACDFSPVPELAETPHQSIPIPELNEVMCSVAIGPFVELTPFAEGELFAPP